VDKHRRQQHAGGGAKRVVVVRRLVDALDFFAAHEGLG
jgi:hypothetical protein